MESLPLTCDCGCKETEQRNIYKEDIGGILVEVLNIVCIAKIVVGI
jgi:hypothetical protein